MNQITNENRMKELEEVFPFVKRLDQKEKELIMENTLNSLRRMFSNIFVNGVTDNELSLYHIA